MSSKVSHCTVIPLKFLLHPKSHLTILCKDAVLSTRFSYCCEVDPILCITLVSAVQIKQLLKAERPEMNHYFISFPWRSHIWDFVGAILFQTPLSYKCGKMSPHKTRINWITMIIVEKSQNLSLLKQQHKSLDYKNHKVNTLIVGVNCSLLLAPSFSEHMDILFEVDPPVCFK